jgi:hypothetical protein
MVCQLAVIAATAAGPLVGSAAVVALAAGFTEGWLPPPPGRPRLLRQRNTWLKTKLQLRLILAEVPAFLFMSLLSFQG